MGGTVSTIVPSTEARNGIFSPPMVLKSKGILAKMPKQFRFRNLFVICPCIYIYIHTLGKIGYFCPLPCFFCLGYNDLFQKTFRIWCRFCVGLHDLPGLCGVVAKQVGLVLGKPSPGKCDCCWPKKREQFDCLKGWNRNPSIQDSRMAILRDPYEPRYSIMESGK